MYAMRQGDIILVYAAPINTDDYRLEKFLQERQVLSPLRLTNDEVNGYRIANGQAELYQEDGSLYLQVFSETVQLLHPEHGTIEVPQGIWLVWLQRKYVSLKR